DERHRRFDPTALGVVIDAGGGDSLPEMRLEMGSVENERQGGELRCKLIAQPVAAIGHGPDVGLLRESSFDSGAEQLVYHDGVWVHAGDVGPIDLFGLADESDTHLAPGLGAPSLRESSEGRRTPPRVGFQDPSAEHAAIEFDEQSIDAAWLRKRLVER